MRARLRGRREARLTLHKPLVPEKRAEKNPYRPPDPRARQPTRGGRLREHHIGDLSCIHGAGVSTDYQWISVSDASPMTTEQPRVALRRVPPERRANDRAWPRGAWATAPTPCRTPLRATAVGKSPRLPPVAVPRAELPARAAFLPRAAHRRRVISGTGNSRMRWSRRRQTEQVAVLNKALTLSSGVPGRAGAILREELGIEFLKSTSATYLQNGLHPFRFRRRRIRADQCRAAYVASA